jgi:nitroimidazol reductase NimA-like FMN-containing flavoprotein (pyridoxamine 5'-phosphate oxidase superfamily)
MKETTVTGTPVRSRPDRVRVLTEAECVCLLAGRRVGRVVFDDGLQPTTFPVCYRLIDRRIVFRPSPASRLSDVAGRPVSFEVAEGCPGDRSGWSILVTGLCQGSEAKSAATTDVVTWATNHAAVARITIQALFGRTLERSRMAKADEAGPDRSQVWLEGRSAS